MCGITGLFRLNPASPLSTIIQKMNETLNHRGPDDNGVWEDGLGIALGHTRLAIQDLSQDGHQPMNSACGRYVWYLMVKYTTLLKSASPSLSNHSKGIQIAKLCSVRLPNSV